MKRPKNGTKSLDDIYEVRVATGQYLRKGPKRAERRARKDKRFARSYHPSPLDERGSAGRRDGRKTAEARHEDYPPAWIQSRKAAL